MAKSTATKVVRMSDDLYKRLEATRDGRTMQAQTARVIEAGLKALKVAK